MGKQVKNGVFDVWATTTGLGVASVNLSVVSHGFVVISVIEILVALLVPTVREPDIGEGS